MCQQRVSGFWTVDSVRFAYRLCYVFLSLLMLIGIVWLFILNSDPGTSVVKAAPLDDCIPEADYESRRAELLTRVAVSFTNDAMYTVETELDRQPYSEINKLIGPKLFDNPNGWSAIARTGGRPFMNFDVIAANCQPWTFTTAAFSVGASRISPITLTNHFSAGKTVNRIWFTHKASNGYPIVVVMTPDGFFNVGGALSPTLQGAATRIGFIGEPFSTTHDYPQHVDEVNIVEIDDDTLAIVYNIHSEAGEGVLFVELHWNAETERPELRYRTAHTSRLNAQLGFAGFNFMRGPTLWGLLSEYDTPKGGIEAFHDGRTVFLVNQNGAVTRSLLVPPVLTTTIFREDIGTNIAVNSKLVMDQPQDVSNYFSITGTHIFPWYDKRTDLILELLGSTVPTINVRSAQKAVNLTLENSEADETVNVFYATDMFTNTVYEFTYTLDLATEDFEQRYAARKQGIVFRSDRAESHAKLYFMPLDELFFPTGQIIPLTDGVITDPHRPSASADGRLVVFDADDYKPLYPDRTQYQRIHMLDISSTAVRRITSDPYGSSNDVNASLNRDGSKFALTTNRDSPGHLNIQYVAGGLGMGTGNTITWARAADWSHTRDEIAFAYITGAYLKLYDTEAETATTIITRSGITNPTFSPSGNKIAYGTTTIPMALYIANRNGTSETQVLTNTNYAAWVDENHIIIQRQTSGETTDLYLINLDTHEETQLTNNAKHNTEPTFLKAMGPTIQINTPADQAEIAGCVSVSGFVGSAGIPTVTVNSKAATVEGDQWSTTLPLASGSHILTATVTDSATGLTAQDSITITITGTPILAISKHGPDHIIINAPITYTLRITNSGSVSATNVIVTDVIPAGASYITSNGGQVTNNVISWTVGTLNAATGVTETYFSVTATQTITNHDYGVRTSCGYSATGDVPVVTHIDIPQLEVTKDAIPTLTQAGEPITYTIRVTNTGNVDLSATITDTLPTQVTPTGILTWTPTITAPAGVWAEQVVVTAAMGYSGTLTNKVTVTTEEGATNSVTETTTIYVTPGFALTKQATPDRVRAGEPITYTIRITNTGNVNLNATITDTLPAQVTPTGILTWTPATIAPAGVWTEQIVVTSATEYLGPVLNEVTVTTKEGPTSFVTVTTEVITTPMLIVTKQATPTSVNIGESIIYTIRITNTGNVELHATITDTLPTQVTTTGKHVWTSTIVPKENWTEDITVKAVRGFTALNVVTVTTEESVTGVASTTTYIGCYIYLPIALKDFTNTGP